MSLSKAILTSAAYVPAIEFLISFEDTGMWSLPWHIMYKCIFFHICAANHCSPSVLLHTMCQMQLLANALGLVPSCAQHVASERGWRLQGCLEAGSSSFPQGCPPRRWHFPGWALSPWPCPGQKPCLWSDITLWHTQVKEFLPSTQINAAKEVLRREKGHIPSVLINFG